MKPANIILIVIIIIGLGTVGFLFSNNRTLVSENAALGGRLFLAEQEVANLKDEKTRAETEIAVLTATDFAKEIELLRVKLQNAESDLAAATKKAAKLETNLNRMKPYKDALAAIDHFFGRPPTSVNLNNIDAKISVLGDSQITVQWAKAEADLIEYISTGSWETGEVIHTIYLIVSKIRGLAS